jgi:hypothetical protein
VSDLCDVAEMCNGVSAACPTDAVQVEGVVCRISLYPTLIHNDTCDGVGKECAFTGPTPNPLQNDLDDAELRATIFMGLTIALGGTLVSVVLLGCLYSNVNSRYVSMKIRSRKRANKAI